MMYLKHMIYFLSLAISADQSPEDKKIEAIRTHLKELGVQIEEEIRIMKEEQRKEEQKRKEEQNN